MVRQVAGRGRRPAPFEIQWRGNHDLADIDHLPRDERRVGDFVGTKCQIEPFLDHVAELVVHDQLDPETGMAIEQPRQSRREKQAASHADAETNQSVDMMEAGIIDPTKVERIALQNAASIASLLLTTEALITELPEEKKETPPMPHGGDY